MNKIVILNRKKIQFYTILAVVVVLAGAYFGWQQTRPATATVAEGTRILELVTGEFRTTTEDGKELETYVFNPSTVYAKKGEQVELRITGFNGKSHPFVIEGLGIEGEVRKGKTTVVRFTAKEAGVYPIECQTHGDPTSGGPMVGYLVIQ